MSKVASTSIVVMTKLPIEGRVNTRMIPELGESGATALHRAMLVDQLNRTLPEPAERMLFIASNDSADASCQTGSVHEGAVAHGDEAETLLTGFPGLERTVRETGWSCRVQVGAGLGARMRNAALQCLEHSEKVLVLGTDAPGIPNESFREMLVALDENDASLIVSNDGGYVAVALRSTGIPLLDDGINWGTETVVKETLAVARRRELAVKAVADWFDIDTVADIEDQLVRCSDRRREALEHLAPRTMITVRELIAGMARGTQS